MSKSRPVIRTSTKAKTATEGAAPTRTTRINGNIFDTSSLTTEQAQKKGATRKPFVDRNNSPEGKGRVAQATGATKGPAKTFLTKSSSALSFFDDQDREPIRVCLYPFKFDTSLNGRR